MNARVWRGGVAVALVMLCACKRNAAPARDERVVPDAGFAQELALPAEEVARVLNPARLPSYEGAVGSVEGDVFVDGDQPEHEVIAAPCAEAEAVYGMRFRQDTQGNKRFLADAIVGVTGYKAFVPQRQPAVTVHIDNCTMDQRTLVLTFGQRLDIVNRNLPSPNNFFALSLERSSQNMVLMATPGGEPAHALPNRPGRDRLLDKLAHRYMVADVFVVPSPLFAVTNRAGHYRIDYIPVGPVSVSTTHPSFADGVTDSKDITITEGKVQKLDLRLTYKAGSPSVGK